MEKTKKRRGKKGNYNKVAQRQGKIRPVLSLAERGKIELRYCTDGWTMEKIGKELNRNKGTISREVRGKTRKGNRKYDAYRANMDACERIEKRGNVSKLLINTKLYEYVVEKLKDNWSPEQISGRLEIDYKEDKTMRISYEAIYQFAYNTTEGKELRKYFARRHKRRATKGCRKAQKLERLASLPSIDVRPDVVNSRERVGDWEDDFVVSRESIPQVKSLNERKTGVHFFRKTTGRTAVDGDIQVIKCFENIPPKFRLTLTRDRGAENKNYKTLQESLGISIFFAHAFCSQERGSNENGNGLLRRYFPKGTNWDMISEAELDKAERAINARPRKRYGYLSPEEVFLLETGVALYS